MRPYAPDAAIVFVHRDEDPRDYRVSFSKIKTRLGFDVSLTVLDGIAEIVGLVKNGIISNGASPAYRN
jgi:hypothetical protein